ncbi:hypothetical protein HPB50_029111 [Hyalomma asiaticum]|nr:hypothetical protein HPB50_029111 [Hyalomma asiaticum]
MPGGAKKFCSKHHFGRSRMKGRGRKANGAATASQEQAPTLPYNASVVNDASPSVHSVDSGRVSRASTNVINRGACETASPTVYALWAVTPSILLSTEEYAWAPPVPMHVYSCIAFCVTFFMDHMDELERPELCSYQFAFVKRTTLLVL